MIIKPRFEGLSTHDTNTWQSRLEEYASRQLRPLLVAHGADATVLHATLRKLPRQPHAFEVQLHIQLPGKKILTASAHGTQVNALTERAVDRLFREARRHFDHLHGQDRYRRKLRRERLRALEQRLAAQPAPLAAEARQSVEALLQRLTPVATRELAYLRASGDLPEGYPTVTDVIDEAAAHTRAAWRPAQDAAKVYQQLLKNLFKAIDREVAAVRPLAQAEPIDAAVKPDADDQAEAMVEEEVYEYYQPDDTLSLADVLPAPETDEDSAQADAVAENEAQDQAEAQPAQQRRSEQAYALDVVKTLPIAWRRALLLRAFDDLAVADIAFVLEAEATAVERWIEQASSFVHARLVDAGMPLSPDRVSEVVLTVLHTRR